MMSVYYILHKYLRLNSIINIDLNRLLKFSKLTEATVTSSNVAN